MKTNLSFDSAELKARRGYKHIDELIAALANLPSSEPFKFAAREKHGDVTWVSFGDDAPAAADLALMIGDAAHNLRSVFDHLWNTLHRACKAEGDKARLTFPFHETRENLEDLVRKSPVKSAFPKSETLILDDLKPHADAGGDAVLWSLTQLDNIDKHNLLIPIVTEKAITSTMVIMGPRGIPAATFTGKTVLKSYSGRRDMVLGDGYEMQGDPKVSVSALFPEAAPAPVIGKDVVETLTYLAEASRKAVQLFREAFA